MEPGERQGHEAYQNGEDNRLGRGKADVELRERGSPDLEGGHGKSGSPGSGEGMGAVASRVRDLFPGLVLVCASATSSDSNALCCSLLR